MTTAQKVHRGIVLVGFPCIIAAAMLPCGVCLLMALAILGIIICFTLKCEKCGQRIATQNPLVAYGSNWGVCTRCHPRQKK
jgi:hypothetical protein